MTTTKPIPLSRLQALRLTCNPCQSAFIIPLTARDVPVQCFNCGQKFPAANILNLLRELHLNQRDLADDKQRLIGISIEALVDDPH